MERSHHETKHVGANSQCTRRERCEHQHGSWENPGPVCLPLTSNPTTLVSEGALATTNVGRGSYRSSIERDVTTSSDQI